MSNVGSIRFVVIIMVVSCATSSAPAQVVFSQDPHLISTLFLSDSQSLLGTQQADDFSLSSSGSINAVTFYGKWTSLAQPLESFTVRFYNSVGGVPVNSPFYEAV